MLVMNESQLKSNLTLGRKALAKVCALNDTWELFGAKDVENIRESTRKDRGRPSVQARAISPSDIDKVHFQPVKAGFNQKPPSIRIVFGGIIEFIPK